MTRTALIWVFFLIYRGKGHEEFKWLELIGFILLVCGTLVYNEIVQIPFFGFNQNTKAAIAQRKTKLNNSDTEGLLTSNDD